MKIQISYNEFANQYYLEAMKMADKVIAKFLSKGGKIHPKVDIGLVKSVAVSYALERVYLKYDVDNAKGKPVNAMLYVVVHNAVLNEIQKAWVAVKRSLRAREGKASPRDDFGGNIINCAGVVGVHDGEIREKHTVMHSGTTNNLRDMMLDRMLHCIKKLPPVEQIIINCWMEDSSNYVENAMKLLGSVATNEGFIYTRLSRAKKKLAKLMMEGNSYTAGRDLVVRRDSVDDEEAKGLMPADKNFERRRSRAATAKMTESIDYAAMSRSLYDRFDELLS